jgi:hypothetical protein
MKRIHSRAQGIRDAKWMLESEDARTRAVAAVALGVYAVRRALLVTLLVSAFFVALVAVTGGFR